MFLYIHTNSDMILIDMSQKTSYCQLSFPFLHFNEKCNGWKTNSFTPWANTKLQRDVKSRLRIHTLSHTLHGGNTSYVLIVIVDPKSEYTTHYYYMSFPLSRKF